MHPGASCGLDNLLPKVAYMNKNLIIWDFDGVIADSEKIWLQNRQSSINKKFNLNWDFQTTNHYLGGMSDATKRDVLDRMGLKTDDAFWQEQINLDVACMQKNGLVVTPGVENIIKSGYKQCVATGGVMSKTKIKLEVIGFWGKYFDEKNVFTADMVSKGKPEPDIFLLAAEKMQERPQNCIVIEDSLAGMTAAQKAGMDVIAFLGSEMYAGDTYLQEVKKLGVKHIFYDMAEVGKFLFDFCQK